MFDKVSISPVESKIVLPEARTQRRQTRQGPLGLMSEVFCVNCGASGGLITEEWAAEVFYLCDACAEKWGPIAEGLTQIEDTRVRGLLEEQLKDAILHKE